MKSLVMITRVHLVHQIKNVPQIWRGEVLSFIKRLLVILVGSPLLPSALWNPAAVKQIVKWRLSTFTQTQSISPAGSRLHATCWVQNKPTQANTNKAEDIIFHTQTLLSFFTQYTTQETSAVHQHCSQTGSYRVFRK